jgi:hypothetical protein
MVKRSLEIDGTVDAKKFGELIHRDFQAGMLEMGYSAPKAKELVDIARDVARLEGKLPIDAADNDTMATLLRKAQLAKAEAERVADIDPFKALSQEVSRIDKSYNIAIEQARKQRRSEPLGFLYEDSMSHMATRAANKILSSQDGIMAAAAMFGKDSPEFNALRQVYVQRFLQREFKTIGGMRSEIGSETKGMTEEVQALMFPGVRQKEAQALFKDMEFLFSAASISGADFGGSLAGASRVLNPWQHIPLPKLGGVSSFLLAVPGAGAVGREVLSKAFAAVVDGTSNPHFLMWLTGQLKGSPEQRLMARQVIQDRLRLGGWMGAAAGQIMAAPGDQQPSEYDRRYAVP